MIYATYFTLQAALDWVDPACKETGGQVLGVSHFGWGSDHRVHSSRSWSVYY